MSSGELEEAAKQIRLDVIEMLYKSQSGHPGGSLSATEMLVYLYRKVLKVSPAKKDDPNRDRFIYSKGHASPALYAVLADRGFFPKTELDKFRTLGVLLQGHADVKVPGVEFSAGSLGLGLSFAEGIALAAKLDNRSYHTYAFIGDGELQEGSNWEAIMTAPYYKLNNLTVIVDRNKIQNDDFVKSTKEIEPLSAKWKAFGWHSVYIDGHDFEQIEKAFDEVKKIKDKPQVIIAETVKGKGVSFMENNPEFHGRAPTEEEYKKALEELK